MNNELLHSDLHLKKGEYFVKHGQRNYRIGKLINGVLRGYALNHNGEEVTTHFFIENNLVSGNYTPNSPATMNIQAVEDCLMSVANYKEIFSHVNSDPELTQIILKNYQTLNEQNHSRIEILITGNSIEKYKWFLSEYPNLLNRVPHYYIANFLGMTPTQLSRTRKALSQQM